MKIKIIWTGIMICLYAGLAVGYHIHLKDQPRKTLVALDTSNAMRGKKNKVLELLKKLEGSKRYTEFSLITDKSKEHGWQNRLELKKFVPYGLRQLKSFKNLKKYPGLKGATDYYLITNADDNELSGLGMWSIISVP